MIYFLTKNKIKLKHFIYLEIENKFLRKKQGVLNKRIVESILNCGTNEKAKIEAQNILEEYIKLGYKTDTLKEIPKNLVFDVAKYHYNGNFPKELKMHQGYVLAGFYIGWAIENKLLDEDLMNESKNGIEDFLQRKITGPDFYEEYLDGYFDSHMLTDEGIEFTLFYFNTDFSKSIYITDYLNLFEKEETAYHVKDSWENYEKLSKIISNRYLKWKEDK